MPRKLLEQIFLTLEECALLIRISVSTLRRRIKAGLIHATKVNRRVVIAREELLAYMERHQLPLES